jgi:hypothetical protein
VEALTIGLAIGVGALAAYGVVMITIAAVLGYRARPRYRRTER